MKTYFSIASVIILLASCGSPTAQSELPDAIQDTAVTVEAQPWPGLYSDTLPCADCPGILTQLDLHDDSTYVLRERYLERDSIPYGRIGRWSVDGEKLLLDGKVEWMQSADVLERLDATGKPIDRTLPNSIQRVENFGSSPMHLTGAYVYYADSHSFTPCGSKFAIPVAMDAPGTKGAGLELERTYGKKVKIPPAPLFVQVTATLRTGPAMEGEGTDEYIHIDRVDRVLEKQECP